MAERRITGGTVYRSASGTNKSLTPRPDRSEDLYRPHRGLSAYLDPEQAITPRDRPVKHRVLGTDVGALRELRARLDDTGHVSLRPASDDVLDILVIAVEIFNPVDNQGNRLIVSADIMDEEGVMLLEGPKYEVPIPSEAQLQAAPDPESSGAAQQLRTAMRQIDRWLASQTPALRAALA
jgi:hypothetical protein